ncbi:type II toxin-antitoxin system RelE family toxin [Streptomyces sp. S6]
MTWQVQWEPTALNAAVGFLKDDAPAVDSLLQVTDRLTEDPRPEGSRAWGTQHRRLRHGPWRILYRIDEEARHLHIEHVGRTAD